MKTVKVRIAVAVDAQGCWNAEGWSNGGGRDAMELACEGVDDGEARYWVTAELPIPEVTEIQGEVE